ncbi:putative RNA polymerase II transcription elongation factor [Bisporella sp. PMI_857]|nr:putative RNA polymerase II transcription elongation factor [Bisporella sp. PMI_857]
MNGHSHGTNGDGAILSPGARPTSKRFSDIPSAIDIPVQGEDEDQAVEIDLEELMDDPSELCTLLENEGAARTYWMTVALAYAKQKKVDRAIEVLLKGSQAMRGGQKERLSILSCLCWMYLWKSRESPRLPSEEGPLSEAKTKEYWLQLSTSTLNEALRINPSFPPLYLARGVLLLLKASLQPPSKSAAPGAIDHEKADQLRASLKSFEDAVRVSGGRNMMAVLGRARALFSLGKYAEALDGYQEALHKMPDLIDPDPRIGIGCCFWQLGFKEDAKTAWERALEINPDSKIANMLLGLFYLDSSSHVSLNGPEFMQLYRTALTTYTQKAFKEDKEFPLTCATFAGYYLSRKQWKFVESLSHKAIQYTDVNAIASDGWYLLARKEHYNDNYNLAKDYYGRADEARGGIDKGFLPAKFGAAQLAVLNNDHGEAKLRLEKIIQQSKNIEAMTLLGTIYAEEVFASQQSGLKEDKSTEFKKAVGFLETVRNAWKDPKKNLIPDASVLLNLARLYENDQPEKSLLCLQQVEQMEFDQIPESDRPKDADEEIALKDSIREGLPPQLLNNMGCFYYQAEKFDQATIMFQSALNACIKFDKEEDVDGDALVTTISFNLGRSYEASGKLHEAKKMYEGLLGRHDEYTDARTRLAYIAFHQNASDESSKALASLYTQASDDLEVRALYGWYLGKVHGRKRTGNIAEDPEMRHYKHTLQRYEKHDRYALIGMGNLYLMTAREMRRETDQEKQKRSAMYIKAVEFFDKALQLDPKNAYAAQGIAIALVEDKKDYKTALAIFVKVRDTVKDPSVNVNLGHIFAELRQYTKAIEHYEAALAKDRSKDAQIVIMACLGRTWLARGKVEKSFQAFKNCLDYSQKALSLAPDQIHFKFNVAFVQIQLATTILGMTESLRTVAEVEAAAAGLTEAIEALEAIAAHPQTPYPKHDIEQRALMARNTMRKQLENALAAQKDYEERNAEKLQAAKTQREAELKRREDAKKQAEEAERQRKQKIADERQKIAERDRELAEARAEETRVREAAEMTTDEETGEKVKRKKKPRAVGGKRKKKNEDGVTDDEGSGAEPRRKSRKSRASTGESDDERPKKKKKLTRKADQGKYKSSEIVVEDDSDDDTGAAAAAREMDADRDEDEPSAMDVDGGSDEEVATVPIKRKSRRARISDDEDEDEDEAAQPLQDDSASVENGDAADTPMADTPADSDDE